MFRRFLMLVLIAAPAASAFAQTGFIERVQEPVKGKGTVTINQDQRLTNIINGLGLPEVSTQSTDAETSNAQPGIQSGKKVKARGYRIQVYWGGSQRVDQTKAMNAGNKVTSIFPELEAYTSFESPHWRCRVGDFVSRQDAVEYLAKMREANLGSGAMIVRSEIFVYQ